MLSWLFPKKIDPFLSENINNDTFQLLHPFPNCFGIEKLKSDDIRVIIARNIDNKVKTILFDSEKICEKEIGCCQYVRPCKNEGGIKKNHSNVLLSDLNKNSYFKQAISTEMISDLMFGTVPMTYQGTITKLHPLFSSGTFFHSFLLTKLFTIESDASFSITNSNNISASIDYNDSLSNLSLKDTLLPNMMSFEKEKKNVLLRKESEPLFTLSRLGSWESSNSMIDQSKKYPFLTNNPKTSRISRESFRKSRPHVYAIGIVITLNINSGDFQDGYQIINQYWSILNNAANALQRSVFSMISKSLANNNCAFCKDCEALEIGKSRASSDTNRRNSMMNGISLYNDTIICAVLKFKERILTAISAPLVIHIPKRTEQKFKEEFKALFKELDNKPCKFFFSVLLTAILSSRMEITSDFLSKDLTEILSEKKLENIVIIGKNASLARRIIYVLSGLIFHDLRNIQIIDYLWPSEGLLCLSRNHLRPCRLKESSSRQIFGWDIPYCCPLSKGQAYSMSTSSVDSKVSSASTSDYVIRQFNGLYGSKLGNWFGSFLTQKNNETIVTNISNLNEDSDLQSHISGSFHDRCSSLTSDDDDIIKSLTKVSAKLNDKGIVEIDPLNTVTEFENSSQVIDLNFHSTPYITGYLDSIHFDFILQACPPSINLELQIQNQLKQRSVDIRDSLHEFKPSEDIVSILVADLSNCAIKKFTLQKSHIDSLSSNIDQNIQQMHNEHRIFNETLTCIDTSLIENIYNYILVN
ncbi:hypothetical protein T552_02293 [Pneumocystis carinii B80]|uniref:UDENN FNIP1/2-type domain-containing protein n=1 Tax=Pneumocystis carinii (strain B80) TaxID=1408658 RepID=A0A0W4ZG10_PNEC8|nr:hypothetical protein T552_02293 [Pneumocystis carinii B80]KTW27311.1 hypothetical protein T552_02293 [Pneumocystis carinii B80]